MPTDKTKQIRIELDRVSSRFPKHMDKIKEFHEKSPTFREIGADYTEIITWRESHCQSVKQPSSSCDYAIDVSRELEAEIMECLEGSHTLVAKCVKQMSQAHRLSS